MERIRRLLEFDSTRTLALGSLAVVTQLGAPHNVNCAVVALNAPLARLAAIAEDHSLIELAVAIMAHATRGVLRTTYEPQNAVLDTMSMFTVLPIVLTILRGPHLSYPLLTHALDLCLTTTRHFPHECRSTPSFVALLASLTRSSDLVVRSLGMCAIIRLSKGEQDAPAEPFFPHKISEILARGAPPTISHIFDVSRMNDLDVTTIINTSFEYRTIMALAEYDFDPCALGRRLAIIIQRHDLVIGEKCGDGDTRSNPPFASWLDAFPLCAHALCQTGSSEDMDSADILKMKFSRLRGQEESAISVAKDALIRNRKLAYAYLVLTMASADGEGLRIAKKGLKCPGITPYVRQQLLWQAVRHGAVLGLRFMQDGVNPFAYAYGLVLLSSALEDTFSFIHVTPPDSCSLLPILNWNIILTILVDGPELSEELAEIEVSSMYSIPLGFCQS